MAEQLTPRGFDVPNRRPVGGAPEAVPSEPSADVWGQAITAAAKLLPMPDLVVWPEPSHEQRARGEAAMLAYEQYLSEHGLLPDT